jgi:hypothetical protein
MREFRCPVAQVMVSFRRSEATEKSLVVGLGRLAGSDPGPQTQARSAPPEAATVGCSTPGMAMWHGYVFTVNAHVRNEGGVCCKRGIGNAEGVW